MRLSHGDYTTFANEQIWARREFFAALGHFVPEAVTALRDDVWPSFLEARGTINSERVSWDDIMVLSDSSTRINKLREKLLEWARRFDLQQKRFKNIEDAPGDASTWLLSCLLHQMDFWYKFPVAYEQESWGQSEYMQYVPPNYSALAVDVYSDNRGVFRYYVSQERREHAKARIMKALEEQVDAALHRIDDEAVKVGFERTSTRKSLEQDLTRLIRFHVLKMSVPDIGRLEEAEKSKPVEDKTIYGGLNRAAKLLAFTRRKAKTGRPSKSR